MQIDIHRSYIVVYDSAKKFRTGYDKYPCINILSEFEKALEFIINYDKEKFYSCIVTNAI